MAGKNTAIVLAAGQGKRMHSKIQKQFLEIQGYPVLYYSLRCFQESPLIQDIILVTGEDALSYCKEEIVKKYGFTKVSNVIAGGKERYDSVYAGLCACKDCRWSKAVYHRRNYRTRIREGERNRSMRSGNAVQRYDKAVRCRRICKRNTRQKMRVDDSDTTDIFLCAYPRGA